MTSDTLALSAAVITWKHPRMRRSKAMNAADMFVIRTNGLSKSYNGSAVLESLSLQVPEKSIFAFLGPNGAGKTTTIKLLLGLIRPTRGGGTIFGLDIVHDSVAIRAKVGYL